MAYDAIMNARMLFYYKQTRGALIVEMVIWQLPQRCAERPHGLKYRLFCGTAQRSIVRYDNETGKGDHRHIGDPEESHTFVPVDRLIEDFRNDCSRLAGWEGE